MLDMDQTTQSQNPNPNATQGFLRSFLQSRQAQRDSGSRFFQDNRIRTCSYVKEKEGGFVAVPFYDKRNNKEYPTKSEWVNSWTSHVHSQRDIEHAGGMNKTLSSYHPDKQRSRINVPDFLPPYRNTSVIELGNRSKRDTKSWVTTYGNSFTGRNRTCRPTNHPGIQAHFNKWDRDQIAK